eukprot:TRINITY_DN8588_c0_g1_i1.p1 TRINITY_DN8588_c0_g1~~TRINITY_DN8588_c0_g1_i1.p1  ORF type:complete len:268 (+),score=126.21 TRINITY_DN8588_c0_g1_i1:93-896(+)
MGRVDPGLKWKILGVMAGVGVLLIVLLGYNLGHQAQDERDATRHEHLDGINQVLRERLSVCTMKLKSRKDANDGESQEFKHLEQEAELFVKENDLLQLTKDDLEVSKQECDDDFRRAMRQRSSEATAKDVVRRLEFENTQLEIALVGFNNTKKQRRQELKDCIRALRFENGELRRRLSDLRKADADERLLRRQIAEERRALQRVDIGLGERGSTRRKSGGKKQEELMDKMEAAMNKQVKSVQDASKLDHVIEEFIETENPDEIGSSK